MTSIAQQTIRPYLSVKWLVPGLVASLVLGMWEMLLEAILGSGFWAPVVFIAATVLRNLQSVAVPVSFDWVAVVFGLMGHMMNSVIFGLLFAALIAPRMRSLGGRIAAGVIYGVTIFAIMWLLVLPVIDPVMLKLNAGVFLLGHMMWGAALALFNNRISVSH